jgi:hypothetical protein
MQPIRKQSQLGMVGLWRIDAGMPSRPRFLRPSSKVSAALAWPVRRASSSKNLSDATSPARGISIALRERFFRKIRSSASITSWRKRKHPMSDSWAMPWLATEHSSVVRMAWRPRGRWSIRPDQAPPDRALQARQLGPQGSGSTHRSRRRLVQPQGGTCHCRLRATH